MGFAVLHLQRKRPQRGGALGCAGSTSRAGRKPGLNWTLWCHLTFHSENLVGSSSRPHTVESTPGLCLCSLEATTPKRPELVRNRESSWKLSHNLSLRFGSERHIETAPLIDWRGLLQMRREMMARNALVCTLQQGQP